MPPPDQPYPMPQAPPSRRLFFVVPTIAGRWRGALRLATTFGVPATILVAAGRENLALLVFLGSFAVTYGEGRAYRIRARIVLAAGLSLLGAALLGALVGDTFRAEESEYVAEILTMTVIAVVGVYVVAAARLGPPGSFSFVLVCGLATLSARSGVAPEVVVGATAVGVVSSLLVSMLGMLLDRSRPERVAVGAAIAAVGAYEHARATGDVAATATAYRRGIEAMYTAWSTVYDAGAIEDPAARAMIAELFDAHARLLDIEPVEAMDASNPAAVQPIPFTRPPLEFRLRRSLSLHSMATHTAARVAVASLAAGSAVLRSISRDPTGPSCPPCSSCSRGSIGCAGRFGVCTGSPAPSRESVSSPCCTYSSRPGWFSSPSLSC